MAEQQSQQKISFFVGGYSDNIQLVEFDPSSSSCTLKYKFEGVSNPSFVKYIPEDSVLVGVKETLEEPTIFIIDLQSESPTYGKVVQELPSNGAHPCHICYSRVNQLIFCSNYTGSTVSVYSYKERKLDLIEILKYTEEQATGEKGNKERQDVSHPHSVTLDSRERFAFLQDLGCDLIRIYSLSPLEIPKLLKQVPVKVGNGPRHLFNRQDKFFLSNELTNSVDIWQFNDITLDFVLLQEINLQQHLNCESYSAEIRASNECIYISVRGEDKIFIIPYINGEVKKSDLSQLNFQSGGKWPRNFNLTENYLICANQQSDNIVIFSINQTPPQVLCTFEVAAPTYIELQN